MKNTGIVEETTTTTGTVSNTESVVVENTETGNNPNTDDNTGTTMQTNYTPSGSTGDVYNPAKTTFAPPSPANVTVPNLGGTAEVTVRV